MPLAWTLAFLYTRPLLSRVHGFLNNLGCWLGYWFENGSGLVMSENLLKLELEEIKKRRTFAIISHPDAGKTTLTEKFLLFGGAIALAGTVKGKKSGRTATSDWMEMEKQRGISITTSVMQFPYGSPGESGGQECIVNLLDTPGHADFSEDTYRTLTAVDSALMVIDAAKGVEERTIKLMEVCRMRDTPIISFINKLDRETRDPMDLLDEIEKILKIKCAPLIWPLGSGQHFRGIYLIKLDKIILFEKGHGDKIFNYEEVLGINNKILDAKFPDEIESLRAEIELVRMAAHEFNQEEFLAGKLSPVFFGTALGNFGIKELLDEFIKIAPGPSFRPAESRLVSAEEEKFSGFVFKIQANMDPNHRDRIAFLRICSGVYKKGMKFYQPRTDKALLISNALTFMAGDRAHTDCAYAGDIIGIYNHGVIQVGDSFSQADKNDKGEKLKFTGIPFFAPELFKRVVLKDPLKMKALQKGLVQLSEEGATQVFKPMRNNDLILGAVGILQFDVVAHRLLSEYGVHCIYDNIPVSTARWVKVRDSKNSNLKTWEEFEKKAADQLALDAFGRWVYLAPSLVNLGLMQERYKEIEFLDSVPV